MGKHTRARIVVKLGTSVLTGGSDALDRAHMVELVRQVATLRQAGHQVIVVTSGAIAAGRERLVFRKVADNVATKQMLAAVGQTHLIQVWEQLFNIYHLHIGQMLLTRADFDDRERFLNARDMLNALLAHGIIPVINENDAVATAEIKVGDNDNLSALVAVLAEADQLLLLTDQSGLFTADPRTDPEATLIKEVHTIDDTLRQLAGGSGTGLGTGGMLTKLAAADVARHAGVQVAIAAGQMPDVIVRLTQGEQVGTQFSPLSSTIDSRKRWILTGPRPNGAVILDAGAVAAIRRTGSLLPSGITDVAGDFARGDSIELRDAKGQAVARGITHYSADDLRVIKGSQSDQIESQLGYVHGAVVVHRNDMVIL